MNNGGDNGGGGRGRAWAAAGAIGLGIAAAAAAVGTAAYLFSGRQKPQQQQNQLMLAHRPPAPQIQRPSDSDNDEDSSYIRDMVSRLVLGSGNSNISFESRNSPPSENPIITNLNGLLDDIYVRFIRLKESEIYYKVFNVIFNDLHRKMKEVDPYYRKYSSTVQFAGSHFDNLRIDKLDEFDMDVVIGLPLSIHVDPHNPAESDFVIEAKAPGFLQLRMGVQYKRLHMRDLNEWPTNKTAFEWQDSSDYLLRSKFIAWFESVVVKALNTYEMNSNRRPLAYVEGVPYILNLSKSGPAITIIVSNASRNFKMDFDLVPALKFPEIRWPISKSYRQIPPKCKKGYWMVVPKPNKKSGILQDETRSWRIALHNQERELMYNSNNLKNAIRLIKKLRDSQRMDMIASYYIKTLFFWEIEAINNEEYWRNNPAVLFKQMVKKLYEALVVGKIPYYWDKRNNLIEGIPYNVLIEYSRKLLPLIQILDNPSQYKLVAKYLLTPDEFKEYNAKYLHIEQN